MHDELLERGLRDALRREADDLPFTITAAELERRLVLRKRTFGVRRVTLLLAAAVGIGLVGVGGALGGWFTTPFETPGPTLLGPAPSDPEPTGPAPTAVAERRLPSLDEMLDTGGRDRVVVAQAHGPDTGPRAELATLDLGASRVQISGLEGTSYELAVACLGAPEIRFIADFPAGVMPQSGTGVACDGEVHTIGLETREGHAWLAATDPASWRIVVRRGAAPPPPLPDPPTLGVRGDSVELVQASDEIVGVGQPGEGGLILYDLGGVLTRESYEFGLWCADGDAVQYIHGDRINEVFTPITTTQVACDGRLHSGSLSIREHIGNSVFVAAAPGTRWLLLVTSKLPPIDLTRSREPNWVLSAGIGPSLTFESDSQGFTGPGGEEGGPVMIVLTCLGEGQSDVYVELESRVSDGGVVETTGVEFKANCSADGATTAQSFESASSYVSATYTQPAGSWTALSILVPDPSP